jgi:hypothetical protein
MTDEEFDILDELYFVIAYEDLLPRVEAEPPALESILMSLFDKGWIRIMKNPDGEDLHQCPVRWEGHYLLASKQGLKAHNSL